MSGEVFGAYLTDGRAVEHSFLSSLAGVMAHSKETLFGETVSRKVAGPGGLADARNALTAFWLDETNAEWLWFVDADMGFAPDTLERLHTSAISAAAVAVGALCFSWPLDTPDGMGGYRPRPKPTIYGWDGQGFKGVSDYEKETLLRVGATGAACLLLHRSAVEKIRESNGSQWWTPVRYPDGSLLGEDLSFCYRLGEAGFNLYVDTSIKTTHAKTIWVGEEDWERWRD